MMSPELLVTVGVILAVLVAASVGLFVGIHFKLWLRAYVSGTGIGLSFPMVFTATNRCCAC